MENIDMSKDQHLMSIRLRNDNMKHIGDIEIKNGNIITTGEVGNKTYNNFVELLKGLQGYGISMDDLYT